MECHFHFVSSISLLYILSPKKWHNVSLSLVVTIPACKSLTSKSSCIIAIKALFKFDSNSSGLIKVSTRETSVFVEPYNLLCCYLRCLILVIYTQNSTVVHGTKVSLPVCTRVRIQSSRWANIVWVALIIFHWTCHLLMLLCVASLGLWWLVT